MFLDIPDISTVNSLSSLGSFILSFLNSIIETLKDMWIFIVNLFNPFYYYDIFSHLPHPFGTILSVLVGFICILLLTRLISYLFSFITKGVG